MLWKWINIYWWCAVAGEWSEVRYLCEGDESEAISYGILYIKHGYGWHIPE